MNQNIVLVVSLETPHVDEPLNAVERHRNVWDAERVVREAVLQAGFTQISITAVQDPTLTSIES